MDQRTKVLLESMIELIRCMRNEGYTREFADFLVKDTGITEEELIECGSFDRETLGMGVES